MCPFDPFDGPDGVLAHAINVDESYVHFDDSEDWTDEWMFLTVAIHEFGHALGLDHTNVSHSVMQTDYPYNVDPKSLLSPDDIQVSSDLLTILSIHIDF